MDTVSKKNIYPVSSAKKELSISTVVKQRKTVYDLHQTYSRKKSLEQSHSKVILCMKKARYSTVKHKN